MRNGLRMENSSAPSSRLITQALASLSWTFSGTVIRLLIRIVALAIFARLISPVEYGLFTSALMVIGFSDILASLGVTSAVIQAPEIDDTLVSNGYWLSVVISSLCFGVVFCLSPHLAVYLRMPDVETVLRVLSVSFLLDGQCVVAIGLLQRNLRFKELTKVDFIAYSLGYAGIGSMLAFTWGNVWAMVGAHLAHKVLHTTLLLFAQPHAKGLSVDPKALKRLARFGSWFSIARIANYIALQGDYFVISRWLGPECLGLYSRAYQLMALPANLFGEAGDKVAFSAMSRVQSDHKRMASAFKRGLALLSLLVLPLSTLMYLMAPQIIQILLGADWTGALVPFRVLCLSTFFRVAYKLSTTVLRSVGALRTLALAQVLYACMVFVGAYVGRTHGITGIAIAVSAALVFTFVFHTAATMKYTRLRTNDINMIYLPNLIMTCCSLTIILVLSPYLEHFHIDTILLLVTESLLFVGINIGLCLLFPSLLGQENQWWINTIVAGKRHEREG